MHFEIRNTSKVIAGIDSLSYRLLSNPRMASEVRRRQKALYIQRKYEDAACFCWRFSHLLNVASSIDFIGGTARS